MQVVDQEPGASRQIDKSSVRFQRQESVPTSQIAPSHEGGMTSRLAGSTVPVSPLGAGQMSPRAPLNLQFHNENIMTFLEKQQKALQQLVFPQGHDAALNKAWQKYQQPLTVEHGHGRDEKHHHDQKSQEQPQHQHGPAQAQGSHANLHVLSQGDHSAQPSDSGAKLPLHHGEKAKQSAEDDGSGRFDQNLAALHDALSLLIKILKSHQKIQRLSVGQLLQLSNKMRVDTTASAARGNQQAAALSTRTLKNMEESVQTGESQVENDLQNADQNRTHELPNENIDMSIFDLSSEHILMGMEAPDDDHLGTDNTNTQRESRDQRATAQKGFGRHPQDLPSQPNQYKESYFRARKLFVSLRKQNDEMRQEQIHYIIGSLKLLVIFLKVSSALDLHRTSPNQLKYIRFLINLEMRLKMTSFVLIQRLSDEEKMNRIAKEALDTHALSIKAEQIEKKRLQAQQNSDKNGVGAAVERLKQLAKEARKRADARKLFDQNDVDISTVDSLLFNKFSLSDLCKLKLDFLAILHIKKQFMQQNFDEHTRVELQRFENQKQTSMLLNEFLEDAKRSHHNLKLLGMYDAPKRDPVKIYFEISAKNLILSNRLTGPALAGDPGFAILLQKYYCSQVLLDRDPRQIHFSDEEINFSPIMEKLGTAEEIKKEFQRLGHTEPLKEGASGILSRNLPPAENKSTNFTKNLTSQRQSELTASAEANSPSRVVPSPLPPDLGLHGAKSDPAQDQRIEVMINVSSAVLDGAMHASTALEQTGYFNKTEMACLIQVSNPAISSDLLVQSLGKHSFGVQLPANVEGLFKIGLLSVAGRQPPQVQWALNAKSSAFQRKQLKDLSKNKNVHGRVTQRGLDLEQSDFLGAIDYKAVEEAQNQDLEGCRSEEHQEAQEQDLREPDAGQEESARHRRNITNSQATHEPSFGRLKSSMGSWATSKPQSYRDGTSNQARAIGAAMAHSEQLKSSSLCTQDLVLLTDFVTLPELVSVFCQAQQEFSGINAKNLHSTEPALMTLERIEDYLLKTGKNELYLKHEGRYVQSNYPASLTQKRTKFSYVQALHPADFSMFQPHGYGPEPLHMHADQDLLLTLLLTSLFNIKSLGQREVPDAGEVELEGQLGSEPRIRRFVEVEAMESVEERMLTWSKGSSLPVNTISQTVLMTQFYLNSHASADELLEPLKSAAKRSEDHAKHTDLDEQDVEFFDQDQDKAVNTGGAKLNLIYVLNQLMIHQTLARLKFEHQAIYVPEIAKLFYRDVLGVHRLYAQTFIDLLECDDPNVFGSYAMMNGLSGPSIIQKKLSPMDDGAENTQKYFFLPYSYDRPQQFEMALGQLRSNQSPPGDAAMEGSEGQQFRVQRPMVPYQDFLENPHIDQERRVVDADQRGDQEDEVMDLQVQEVREAKQRFLQKLANQIQRDHIENEKLHFLVKQHLVEESSTIWSGPLEPEKEEEQKGHHATRTQSFVPGSIGGPSDGKQAAHEANQKMSGGPRLDSASSPSNVPPSPGAKMPQSTTSANPPSHHNKAGAGSALKIPTAESGGSQGTLQRGDPKQNPKSKYAGTGPASSDMQSNKVALHYRDVFKIDEAERARLLRILRKQGTAGSSPGKRLTEEQRMLEVESIERKGLQDILKKVIIEAEYQLEVWHCDTLARVTNETKTFFLGGELNQIEELLYACDLELLKQRKVLVTMLKSVEHGMDDREYSIREQLRQIAILEMQKGKDEDEMLDQTLKAIEIDVHIADIAVEKERLTSINKNLLAKQAELEKQVDELDDSRRRRGRSGAALSPRLAKPARDSGNPDLGSTVQKKDSAGRGQAPASPKDLASIVVPGAPFEQAAGGKKLGEKSRSGSLSDD